MSENDCQCSGKEKSRMSGRQLMGTILGSVLILTVGSIITVSMEDCTLKARDQIKYNSAVKIAQIKSHEHEHINHEDIDSFNNAIGRERADNEEIINELIRSAQGINYQYSSPAPAYHEHKGKSGVQNIDDEVIAPPEDGSSGSTLSPPNGFSDGSHTLQPVSPEQVSQLGALTAAKTRQLCPQIKTVINGKSSEQIEKYERVVANQLMPDNPEQAMTILNKVIESCKSANDG